MTDPDDLETIFEVDALTDPRLGNEAGVIQLVPPEDRISGPGTSDIMASFAHLDPDGSRFSDGTYSVFYAANDLDTAIAESLTMIGRLLGHTQVQTTARYAHLARDSIQNVATRIVGNIGGNLIPGTHANQADR